MAVRLRCLTALILLTAALALLTDPARAQSIDGFKVGDGIKTALLTHAAPSATGQIGNFDGYKWDLANGNATSVTVDPETDKIVFIGSDWGGGGAPAKTDVPGLFFGKSTLGAIRRKFGSNGFSFKAHAMKMIGDQIISVNGYALATDQTVALMLVTSLPVKDVPEIDGKPAIDPAKGTLQSVILARIDYLQSIWGEDRVADPKSHPIDWK